MPTTEENILKVKRKINETLKERKGDRNELFIFLASCSKGAESHWDTLHLFLDDDEDFTSFLESLIEHVKERNGELTKHQTTMKEVSEDINIAHEINFKTSNQTFKNLTSKA